MDAIIEILPILLKGLKVTVGILLASAVLSYIMAFIAGLSRLSNNKFLRMFTGFYVEIFRGTSLIVQLFWLYFALPYLFGIDLSSEFWVGAIAIALNYGAYMSEVVRSAILSVSKGQTEAAIALNLSSFQRMRYIILPQAVRMMLPEFGNYLIQMLKATSLVSLISLHDILYYGNDFRNININLAPTVYLVMLGLYFLLALPLIWLTRWSEGYSKKGVASE